MKSLIIDLHNQLKSGAITPEQLVQRSKDIWLKNKDLNTIITPNFDVKPSKFDPDNLLSCIPYSLKDNICTKGILTTGGSKSMSNYVPPFSATCYELLQVAGATLIAKDSMDELGLGGTGQYCYTGLVKNPNNPERITGGSSSGSVSNVKLGISAFALGTDTGDSIRRPSSLVGTVGYKPTYGAISRYGVYPYAPSLDHVGIITTSVTDAVIVASYVFKHDDKDCTSSNRLNDVKLDNLKANKNIKFVVFKSLLDKVVEPYKTKFLELVEKLKLAGHTVLIAESPDLNRHFNDLAKAYRILSYMEGYSCWSNYTGLTYGLNIANEDDDYETTLTKNRTANFGDETKKRFALGAYLTRAEAFEKNMKDCTTLRAILCEVEDNIFNNLGDCIIMPTVHGATPKHDKPFCDSNYADWLMLSNFSGSPSITIPLCKVDGMPFGIALSMSLYKDMQLLCNAYEVENIIEGGNHE